MKVGNITTTQAKIIEALRSSGKAMTVRDISAVTGLSNQGVRNQMQYLVSVQLIDLVPSVGNAALYTAAGDETVSSLSLLFNGELNPMLGLLAEYAENGLPRNAYDRVFADTVIRLFEMAVYAVDDSNPEHISLNELRNMSLRVYAAINAMEKTLAKLKAIGSVAPLWDPRELPRVLILKDNRAVPDVIKENIYRIRGELTPPQNSSTEEGQSQRD